MSSRTPKTLLSLRSLLFPMAMLVLNVTVVGVIWFGGIEVDAGSIEIGTLFAFMQYIAQILMGVLMASFMVIMIPRAAVSAWAWADTAGARSASVRPAAVRPRAITPRARVRRTGRWRRRA